jgi:hypothetical protein
MYCLKRLYACGTQLLNSPDLFINKLQRMVYFGTMEPQLEIHSKQYTSSHPYATALSLHHDHDQAMHDARD